MRHAGRSSRETCFWFTASIVPACLAPTMNMILEVEADV